MSLRKSPHQIDKTTIQKDEEVKDPFAIYKKEPHLENQPPSQKHNDGDYRPDPLKTKEKKKARWAKQQSHDHHGHQHATVKKGVSYTSALVLLAAMGLHGLFEGLAYGVEKRETNVWNMFIAIAAHKWCDSLIVGISFVNAELPFRMAVILTIFLSLFTPMGIFIGNVASVNQTVTGICQSLSAGTFIYISCAEIIIEEFSIAEKKNWKFLMFMLGILFVTLMTQLELGK